MIWLIWVRKRGSYRQKSEEGPTKVFYLQQEIFVEFQRRRIFQIRRQGFDFQVLEISQKPLLSDEVEQLLNVGGTRVNIPEPRDTTFNPRQRHR